jgi:hypothetical protein
VRTFGLSTRSLTAHKPFFLTGSIRFHAHGPARVAPRHHGPKAGYIYHHVFLNLLGAMQRALLLLLGTTPFAALLALFTIAALGAARLQYPVPALGRSASFARRERPG